MSVTRYRFGITLIFLYWLIVKYMYTYIYIYIRGSNPKRKHQKSQIPAGPWLSGAAQRRAAGRRCGGSGGGYLEAPYDNHHYGKMVPKDHPYYGSGNLSL